MYNAARLSGAWVHGTASHPTRTKLPHTHKHAHNITTPHTPHTLTLHTTPTKKTQGQREQSTMKAQKRRVLRKKGEGDATRGDGLPRAWQRATVVVSRGPLCYAMHTLAPHPSPQSHFPCPAPSSKGRGTHSIYRIHIVDGSAMPLKHKPQTRVREGRNRAGTRRHTNKRRKHFLP